MNALSAPSPCAPELPGIFTSAMPIFSSAVPELKPAWLPPEDIIFPILRHLALAEPQSVAAQTALLKDLAASPELFKIIVTSRPRGTIPAELWHSSYVIFLESLEEIHQSR